MRSQLETMLLSVLESGPAHGYEVIAELRRRSSGEFDLPEGTVYPALHKLERSGLLVSEWDRHDGRRRRVYRLSATGVAALREARGEWRRFARGVDLVLGVSR